LWIDEYTILEVGWCYSDHKETLFFDGGSRCWAGFCCDVLHLSLDVWYLFESCERGEYKQLRHL
jgi:hypothetical protein